MEFRIHAQTHSLTTRQAPVALFGSCGFLPQHYVGIQPIDRNAGLVRGIGNAAISQPGNRCLIDANAARDFVVAQTGRIKFGKDFCPHALSVKR
jgi:hypothetical protein